MDPSVLIPTPDAIPLRWEWFYFLLILTFTLHILLANVMLGSGIIAFVGELKGGADPAATALQKDISEKLTFIIAFTVNFGVAPFLFLQVLYGHFIYVSSVLMAVYWLSVIALLIIAYYSAYYYKFRFETLKTNTRRFFIGTSVVILLFIGFLFANNMTLMLNPASWLRYFQNAEGTLLNLSDPTLFPRFLHFVTASLSVAGLFISILWSFKEKKGIPGAKENVDRGMKWFVCATMFQLFIGCWFMLSLPKDIMLLFMGHNLFATGIFLATFALAAMALLFGVYRKIGAATGSLLCLVFLMVLMRDIVRTAYLKPFFEVSQLMVLPHYSPFIFFTASLAVSIAVVAYVIRLAVKAQPPCP